MTGLGGAVYRVLNGVVYRPCGVPGCDTLEPITWGDKEVVIGKIVRGRRHPRKFSPTSGVFEMTVGLMPRTKKVCACQAHWDEFETLRRSAVTGTAFIKVKEL